MIGLAIFFTMNDTEVVRKAIESVFECKELDLETKTIIKEHLELTIPKRPYREDENDTFDGNWKIRCPRCNRMLMRRVTKDDSSIPHVYNYTNNCICGQRLDRSYENVLELDTMAKS